MAEAPLLERAVPLTNGPVTYKAQAFRGYSKVVVLRIESTQGVTEYYLDPTDAANIASAIEEAALALMD